MKEEEYSVTVEMKLLCHGTDYARMQRDPLVFTLEDATSGAQGFAVYLAFSDHFWLHAARCDFTRECA